MMLNHWCIHVHVRSIIYFPNYLEKTYEGMLIVVLFARYTSLLDAKIRLEPIDSVLCAGTLAWLPKPSSIICTPCDLVRDDATPNLWAQCIERCIAYNATLVQSSGVV